MTALPSIPFFDARGLSPAATARCLPRQLEDLMQTATRRYTRAGLTLGDAVSRRWLARNGNPYLAEISETADVIGRDGAYLLNVSYEWACTTGTRPAPGGGQMLLRVLDWDLDGLGRNLCAIRRAGPAGEWIDIGWPGFSGAITGMAPGRFAAAINQPPLPSSAIGRSAPRPMAIAADWLASRSSVWRSRALPPAHLLRRVFDEAPDWDSAIAMLAETPLSAGAFFTVAGPNEGQGCVIERTQTRFAIRRAEPTVAVANHWLALPDGGIPRGHESAARLASLEASLASADDPFAFGWLRSPVICADTRIALVADPASGRLLAQGWERGAVATAPLAYRPNE